MSPAPAIRVKPLYGHRVGASRRFFWHRAGASRRRFFWPCATAFALLGCVQRDADETAYGARAGSDLDAGVAALECSEPAEGCRCAGNQPPIACQPERGAASADARLCQEGTRYCRAGRFGACERVHDYAPPSAAVGALIDPRLAHPRCSDCDPNCYRVRDDLDPAEGPLDNAVASGLSYHSSGAGLTLTPGEGAIVNSPPDASVPAGSIYLAIPEGLTASAVQTARVRPAQSDVYLLLDQSSTMADETASLYDGLDHGMLIDDATRCGGSAASADAGVAGALQCITDRPELGLGMFRDIPFDPYATDESLPASARAADAKRELAFRQQLAQSSDLLRVKTAIAQLGAVESSGDPDVAGSQIVALASIASRQGLFMGIDRAFVPDGPACSGSRSGYPCFRSGSPIVMLVTDAPFHNGPLAAMYPYDYAGDLTIQAGTVAGHVAVPPQNDDWDSAFTLSSDAAGSLAAFYGTTAPLQPNLSAALVGCGASDSANDALFRFDVDAGSAGASANVRLSAEGSSFDGVLGVFDGIAPEPELLAVSGHANELFASAYDLDDVSGRDLIVAGDTSAAGMDMSADYQGALFGAACGANTLAPDAAFAFNLVSAAAPTQLELRLDSGDAHGVLAVYAQAAGALPLWPLRSGPPVAVGNIDAAPEHVYTIASGPGQEYVSVVGDSAVSSSSFDAGVFGAGECDPDPSSKDVAFEIHVSGTHHLRFDSEGSSFDTVLGLYSAPPPTKADPPMTFGGYLGCDDDGVSGTSSSVIERMLSDGDYYLVLKGKHAGDEGAYVLTVRDVDAVTTEELACDASGGRGDPAVVRFTAMPGASYYALVKGTTPLDKGTYALHVRDLASSPGTELACDGGSGAGGAARLDVQLASGSYYAVLKGRSAGEAGDYRLTIGGADPVEQAFAAPTYTDTLAALKAQRIRVGTVLACSGGASCDDAYAQATQLAHDTGGAVRRAADAGDVPLQVVKTVQMMESFDSVRGQLVFSPDANPGFTRVAVTPLADAGNGCSGAIDTSFHSCVPGANPSFRAALTNPALAPVASGTYHFTLRVTARRGGRRVLTQDVPLYVASYGAAPPGTYSHGSYHQDVFGSCAQGNQQPSWDRLTFDADVRPDTRVVFYACSADSAENLATCDDGARSSGYARVITASAGTGSGRPCSVATQAQDCPDGYCSPYTNVCIELEGAACAQDEDCPGSGAGRCRAGASAATLGNTCHVDDAVADPSSALDAGDLRPFVRVRADLESLADGSRTPGLFFWEVRYWCRNVE